MVEPEDVAFKTIDKSFAERERDFEQGILSKHLLKINLLLWVVFRV